MYKFYLNSFEMGLEMATDIQYALKHFQQKAGSSD